MMPSSDQKRPVRPKPKSYFSAPFLWIDWLCQWIAFLAGNLAVFRVLEYAGKLTVAIALITWIAGYPQRQQAAIQAAWSIVNTKGGGRKAALEELAGHQVDLKGMYATDGYFANINLSGRDLRWSELTGADFESANMEGAQLQNSILLGTSFKNANLRNANFQGASLSPNPATVFDGAQIDGADFRNMKLPPSGKADTVTQILKGFLAAQGWQKAQFDNNLRTKLACMADSNQSNCPSLP
jgi:hypothetical protein